MKLAFLALPADERRLYIEQVAVRRNISPVVLEKDFWVCWLLGILFESEFAGSLVFKGGTSLSKVHRHVRAGSPTAAEIARHLLGESNAASVNPASTYRHPTAAPRLPNPGLLLEKFNSRLVSPIAPAVMSPGHFR